MINLELEDLTDNLVKYSFFYNSEEKGYIHIDLNTLQKRIENNINISENIIDKIYEKILWYKQLDNFFKKGFA